MKERNAPWSQEIEDLADQQEDLVRRESEHSGEQDVLRPAEKPAGAIVAALQEAPSCPKQ